jgi:hypothetical protein
MKFVSVFAICLVLCASAAAIAATPVSRSDAPYDANPRHLWNRLNEELFVRTAPDDGRYGNAELDILFWSSTKYLLTSSSHENAIRVLDEFIRGHGERLIRDPMKRAMLQRDLWALFDWSAHEVTQPASELQRRLVTVIKRLALSADEIGRLPDNYAEAEPRLEGSGLPHALFAPDGGWLLVGRANDTAAPEHTSGVGGRSVFLVFVKFPGEREQALQYLKALREFVPALVYTNDGFPPVQTREGQLLRTNPATPQFPVNTQWALVRRLCLIDARGEIRATRLIESIQTRSYLSIPDIGGGFDAFLNSQAVAEFQLDREHAPSLRAVKEGEKDFQFVHFRSLGMDPFEQLSAADWVRDHNSVLRDPIRGETLRTCKMCHVYARGILSVHTYAAFGMAANKLDGSTLEREASATLAWKSRQFDWGLLKGLWPQ